MLLLANLSDDVARRDENVDINAPRANLGFNIRQPSPATREDGVYGSWNVSAGWPLLWRQYIVVVTPVPGGVFAWCYSPARLAIDVAVWLAVIAAAGVACDLLLRRYQPGFRWSLRTLLAAVAFVAVFCAWFRVAWRRAATQEPVLTAAVATVWVERWGPQWLALVGAEPYFRRIVGASVYCPYAGIECQEKNERAIRLLSQVPSVQYLLLEVDTLTPAMSVALGNMHQLRTLHITFNHLAPDMGDSLTRAFGGMPQLRDLDIEENGGVYNAGGQRRWRDNIAAIGQLMGLESLRLSGAQILGGSFRGLAALRNLESLSVHFGIPVRGELDVRYLSSLPHLKSLSLWVSDISATTLAGLKAAPSLEELTIEGRTVSPAGLEALCVVSGLKRLHLGSVYGRLESLAALSLDDGDELEILRDEVEAYRSALESLRKANPGIVVDRASDALRRSEFPRALKNLEKVPDLRHWAHHFIEQWKEGKGEFQRAPFLGGTGLPGAKPAK
jgi:hypothetical protein